MHNYQSVKRFTNLISVNNGWICAADKAKTAVFSVCSAVQKQKFRKNSSQILKFRTSRRPCAKIIKKTE